MKKMTDGSLEGSKLLYEVCNLLAGVTASNRPRLQKYLDLHGPEEFVRAASFRTEEPLKGYRQWVLDDLVVKARKNGVI
jgi:hypothetical protein